MTTEYSPCSDDEYEVKRDNRHNIPINDNISDSETDDCTGKNDRTIKTENSTDVLNHIPKKTVPNANVPEKIILCLDACQNPDSPPFILDHGTTFTPLNMLKRITEFFLYSKQSINSNTEFALVILKESEPLWVHHFTKNIIEIIIALDSFENEECSAEEFDLSKLFSMISEKVIMPDICADYKLVPPSNIVRLILMYNRSNCLPKLTQGVSSYENLKDHPYFTMDILYAHEEKCSGHKCEEIFDTLQSLDNGYSYMFEVVRSATKIHECTAKLLAHPLQRPLQKNSSYSFLKDK